MDKSKIKQVRYSREKKSLFIEFIDGSKYGETGQTALSTLKQLNDNGIEAIDIDAKKLQNAKV